MFDEKVLDNMAMADLRTLAKENEVDLTGIKKKVDIISAILEQTKVEEVIEVSSEESEEVQGENLDDGIEELESVASDIQDESGVSRDSPSEDSDQANMNTNAVTDDSPDGTGNAFKFPKVFRPTVRPTLVRGEPKGYIPLIREVFIAVTTDPDWESKIDTHRYRLHLLSVRYWKEVNGVAKVRCNSSSKFSEAL